MRQSRRRRRRRATYLLWLIEFLPSIDRFTTGSRILETNRRCMAMTFSEREWVERAPLLRGVNLHLNGAFLSSAHLVDDGAGGRRSTPNDALCVQTTDSLMEGDGGRRGIFCCIIFRRRPLCHTRILACTQCCVMNAMIHVHGTRERILGGSDHFTSVYRAQSVQSICLAGVP